MNWLAELGYSVIPAEATMPNPSLELRSSYREAVLVGALESALRRLNPTCSEDAIEGAIRQLLHVPGTTLIERNRHAHRLIVDGVAVETQRADGSIGGELVRVLDFEAPDRNDWLAANQFSVKGEGGALRRPDIVLFLNGLPVMVMELKNPASETATVWDAFQQLQTYLQDIAVCFVYNAVLAISDGVDSRIGSITASDSRYGGRFRARRSRRVS